MMQQKLRQDSSSSSVILKNGDDHPKAEAEEVKVNEINYKLKEELGSNVYSFRQVHKHSIDAGTFDSTIPMPPP